MLAWISIILSFLALIGLIVAAILDYNERNTVNASKMPFIIGLIALIVFFIAWVLFIFYLFMSKGLDLTMEARKKLGDILPDPDVIRTQIVNASDEKFAQFVNG